ncbi:MAG: Voltage-gated ClC-type chloride channel ClcB [Phycisphaerae bacterium]|nr:Voltage-gated ClC-type chloride channel ClcB [Phycisphaerae bacterium]
MERKGLARLSWRFQTRLLRLFRSLGFREDSFLLVLAIVIGLGTGVGAVGFDWLVVSTEEFCFGKQGSPGLFTGSWWWLMPVLPALGGLLVGTIHAWFTAHGHSKEAYGVPEVMDAILRKDSVIPPRVSVTTAAAASLTIGSGGSAGPEGPIIAIGASIGSTIGQLFHVRRGAMSVLVGCGIAAGISSIFNAPIAGVLFALEIFLFDFSFRTFTPVVLSSVISATITQTIKGDRGILELVRVSYRFHWWELGNYVILGLLAGLVSVAFIAMLFRASDFFSRALKAVPRLLRPALGGLVVGLMGLVLMKVYQPAAGAPVISGRGYDFIQDILNPATHAAEAAQLTVLILGLLLAAKLVATCITLGSGGDGGNFAPALFLGATLGALLALVLNKMFPSADIDPIAYAAVGMVAVLAGTVHAYLTAIVLLVEVTKDYHMMLPAMLAVTVATAVSQVLRRQSIYTEALARRGVVMGRIADMTLLRGLYVDQLPLSPAVTVHENEPLSVLIQKVAATPAADFVVLDDQERYCGMIVAEDLRVALLEREAVPLLLAKELVRPEIPLINPHDSLVALQDHFTRHEVASLPVVDLFSSDRVLGLVTRSAMMRCYQEKLQSRSGYGSEPA